MKKIFLLASFVVVAFSAEASCMFTSWCGKVCQTVDESFFETTEEWKDYCKELNVLMCGSEEDPNASEDAGEAPADKP